MSSVPNVPIYLRYNDLPPIMLVIYHVLVTASNVIFECKKTNLMFKLDPHTYVS